MSKLSGWQRLGQFVAAERARRRWSVEELAEFADLSPRTVEYIESGLRGRYRTTTLGRMEDALGWAPGSCQRVVSGGQPDRGHNPLLERVRDSWPYLTPAQQQALVDLIDTFIRQR